MTNAFHVGQGLYARADSHQLSDHDGHLAFRYAPPYTRRPMTGRNEPCPCGSGRKYKHCCARADAAAAPTLRLLGRDSRTENERLIMEAIAIPTVWQAEVSPMPAGIKSDLAARPAVTMLVANGVVLCADMDAHPPSDASGIAALIAAAVERMLAQGGAAPRVIEVRHESVAAELSRLLKPRGVNAVHVSTRLHPLDDILRDLRRHMLGTVTPPISSPTTWAAWDLPSELVTDVFRAAASYFRATPWVELTSADLLSLATPNRSHWFACVLGNASESFGLVLYEHLDDFINTTLSVDSENAFDDARGIIITLNFDARNALRRETRKEIEAARWPVAGPSAYPTLWTLNTLGGGLPVEYARDLVTALDVITTLVVKHIRADDAQLDNRNPEWTIAPTGTIVRMALTLPPLWQVPERLTPSLPEGACANARASIGEGDDANDARARDSAMIKRFAMAEQASGAASTRVRNDVGNADLFLNVMHGRFGVPFCAVTELQLRLFLYAELPRNARCSKAMAHQIRSSLQRFVPYLATHESLSYPWARPILRDRAAFEARWNSCPHDDWMVAGPAWMCELYDDLDDRVMQPGMALAGVGEWQGVSKIDEAIMHQRLEREWMRWRDEEIRNGHTHADALRVRLEQRQATWETTPDPAFGGLTPAEVVARERRGSGRKRARKR